MWELESVVLSSFAPREKRSGEGASEESRAPRANERAREVEAEPLNGERASTGPVYTRMSGVRRESRWQLCGAASDVSASGDTANRRVPPMR